MKRIRKHSIYQIDKLENMKIAIKIYTIGVSGLSAEDFFERLKHAGVKTVIDTRLWAGSQLAGFAKKKDLPYFLKEIGGIDYEYCKELTPSDATYCYCEIESAINL